MRNLRREDHHRERKLSGRNKSAGKHGKKKHPEERDEEKDSIEIQKGGRDAIPSHLELAHLFYRASKRADLPLCFSEGFHPMPRIIFATALPVGMESLTEIVDMECEGKITPLEVMERLNQTLPPGIEIMEAEEVPLFFHLSSLPIRRSIGFLWIISFQKKKPSQRSKKL